jgi:CRISPR-associated protein Csm2
MSSRGQRTRRERQTVSIKPEDIEAIIVQGNAEMLVTKAKEIGRGLRDAGLTTAQIRNIFGTIRQIEMSWPIGAKRDDEVTKRARRQLLLLKPRLAYQAKRTAPVEGLRDILTPAIDAVDYERERFQHLVDLFESILAYHTAYGGKRS